MMKKKVIFITTTNLYDKFGNGGVKVSQKNYQLIEEYFGKANVYLCTFPRKKEIKPPKGAIIFKRTQNEIEQLIAAMFGCKVYFSWNEKKIIDFIEKKNVDLLFIDSSVLGRLAKVNIKCKTIVFYHNIETDYAWNKVKNEGIKYIPSYWASKYNDKCGVKADKVICLNGRDSDRLMALYGRKADFFLPVTFSDEFDTSKTITDYKREMLFLGSLFAPNQISIEWFIKEVMPKLSNIVLNIVGKGFEKMRSVYERTPNVKVIGSVEALDEYYYHHSIVIMPIQCGAGMKVKTAEAMMYGRRILASDEALEGYEVEGVQGITRCNTAEEYVDAIKKYFEEEQQLPYQPSVRKLFVEKYETNSVRKVFEEFMDEFMEG